MAMKSMKLTKAERKNGMGGLCSPAKDYEGPAYPYGLEVRLDRTSLDKLGMQALPEVGEEMTLTATVYVKNVRMEAGERDNDSREVCLQITEMSLGEGGAVGAMNAVLEDDDE